MVGTTRITGLATAVGAAVLLALFLLSSSGRAARESAATGRQDRLADAASSTTKRTFTSTRYHYAITVPAGWKVKPATIDMLPTAFPNDVGPETDVLSAPGSPTDSADVGIASVKLPPGATLKSWTATTTGAIAAQWSCTNPARGGRTLDGATANELTYGSCVGAFFIELAFVNARRGYDLYWLSSYGHKSRDRATFDRLIKSFKFTG